MKAKLVRENINFERGGKDHIYTKIGLGERTRVLELLDNLADNSQLRKDDAFSYMGFINTGLDLFPNHQDKEAYKIFVKKWSDFLLDLKERGLYLVDPPSEDETIFYDNSILDQNISVITPEDLKESLDFERGKDPKDALDIGRKALLRRKAESIDWDWYPDPTDHEELIDVIHFPQPEDQNLYIKLSRLTDQDGDFAYRAVNNIGEPYNSEPAFFSTPEEALSNERKFLTDYFEDQDNE